MKLQPEVRLAARLVDLRNLRPPIDVRSLVTEFAELHEVPFPVEADLDGICLGLKRPKQRPIVIVNSRRSDARRRFTLAHELGHLLIPWHTGNVFDNTSRDYFESESDYWKMESEANRFASELLMPTAWMNSLLVDEISPPNLVRHIQYTARVSRQSAVYKLSGCLPPGFLFADVAADNTVRVGKSPGTAASLPYPIQIDLLATALPWASRRWKPSGSTGVWWWDTNFSDEPNTTEADWRTLLAAIMEDILASEEHSKFKASFSGVVAAAHSHEKERSPANVLNSSLQRLHARASDDEQYARLLAHVRFRELLDARVWAFFAPKVHRSRALKDDQT